MAENEIKQYVSVDTGDSVAQVARLLELQKLVATSDRDAAQAATAATASVKAEEQAQGQATEKIKTRAQVMAEMRARHVELIDQEKAYQVSITQTGTTTAEAAQKSRQRREELEDLTGRIVQAGDAEKESAQRIKEHGAAAQTGREQLDSLKHGFVELATGALGFASAGGALVKLFEEIGEAAKKAHEAVVELGKELADIAAIKGGKLTDAIHKTIEEQAISKGVDPKALTQAALAHIEANPDESPKETDDAIQLLAGLQQATSKGAGRPGAQLMTTMQRRLGVSGQQAQSMSAQMLARGFDPETLRAILQRSGGAGGTEFAALLAAAEPDLPTESARSLTGLLDKLDNPDQFGNIPMELQMVGIRKGMSPKEAIDALNAKRSQGQMGEGMVANVMGGRVGLGLLDAAKKAEDSGEFDKWKTNLANPNAAAEMAKRAGESDAVAHARKQQSDDTAVEAATAEPSLLRDLGDAQAELRKRQAVRGHGSRFLGSLQTSSGPLSALAETLAMRHFEAQGADAAEGNVTVNVTNNAVVHNRADPALRDSGRRDQH